MPYKYNPLLAGKLDRVGAGADKLDDLEDVNTAGTVDGYVLSYEAASGTWKPAAGGAGDMLKSDYVTGQGTVYNASRLEENTLGSVRDHNVAAAKITSGTIGLARIPAVDDARIPDLETLSYGAAFAVAQIPNLGAAQTTSGTFGLARIPAVDDTRIPDLETLSYGAAFAEGQIPNLPTTKITSGTFGLARIPSIDNAHLAGGITSDKIPALSGTAIAYPLNADTVGTTQIIAGGVANSELAASGLDISKFTVGTAGVDRIPSLPAGRVTTGTFGLARIPPIDDARIPDLETLSYGAAFATAQIPSIGAYKITSGTLAVARHQTLNNLNGTVDLVQIPTMDDAHIPNLETLSYGGTFAEAQIPNLPTSKIISGTFNALRIPALPNLIGTLTDPKIPDVETLSYGATFAGAQIPNLGASKITTGTFNANRIPALPTSRITSGTFGIARIPTMDDGHIPNLEGLSYGGAFATTQIPNLPTSKITSGSFNADRIPILPTDRYGSAVLVSGERTLTANLNFGSHEALNMQLEQLGTHPAAARGRIYYNTTDDKIYVHIGTA